MGMVGGDRLGGWDGCVPGVNVCCAWRWLAGLVPFFGWEGDDWVDGLMVDG